MSESIVAFLAIALAVIIISTYFVMVVLIDRRFSVPESRWLLFGLALLVYGVWWIVAIPFGFFIGFNGSNSPFTETLAEAVVYNTFGLRFLNICMYFPELNNIAGGWFCEIVVTYITPILFFFLLGLLVTWLRRVRTPRTL
ncbi:MAG TPA: hypothetical protein VGE04_15360 [Chloroflexia bacterium]